MVVGPSPGAPPATAPTSPSLGTSATGRPCERATRAKSVPKNRNG